MAWLSILDRFRPVGAPGPVGPAGVPAQDAAGPLTELVPVFDALRPDVEHAGALIADAAAAAQEIADTARHQAAAVLADARARGPQVRADAASAARGAAEADRTRLDERARTQVVELEARAARRLPDLVDRAVALVLLRGASPDGPAAGTARTGTPGSGRSG